jgi:hypothetical protein
MIKYLLYTIIFISAYIVLGSLTALYVMIKLPDCYAEFITKFKSNGIEFVIYWPIYWAGVIVGIIRGGDDGDNIF